MIAGAVCFIALWIETDEDDGRRLGGDRGGRPDLLLRWQIHIQLVPASGGRSRGSI